MSLAAQLEVQKRRRSDMGGDACDEATRQMELGQLLLEKKLEAVYAMVPAAKLKAQKPYFEPPEWCGKPQAGVHLVVKKGDAQETVMVDVGPYYLFGRNVDVCDVPMEHPSISRVHCALIHHESGSVYVMDLGTAHGTFLGGERLAAKKPTKLAEGVDLRLGASSRVYRLHMGMPAAKKRRVEAPKAATEDLEARRAQEQSEREQAARAAADEINRRRDQGGGVHKAKADFWGGAGPSKAAAAAASAKDGAEDAAAVDGGVVKLSHVLIRHVECDAPYHPVTGEPLGRSIDAALELAARLKQGVLVDIDGRGTGHAFGKIAKKHSECITAAKKGALGKVGSRGFLADVCPPAVQRAGAILAEDAISDPIESEGGVHLVYRHVNGLAL